MNTLFNWCPLPTPEGEFRMYDTGDESVRIVSFGDLYDQGAQPLLRMHSSCVASEVFGAIDCDCADQLRESMKRIARERRGLIVHLHQEGRGQGLSNKIRAVHAMHRDRIDTVEAFEALGLEQDVRSYEPVVRLLRHLKLDRVRLISNNPAKVRFLQNRGVDVEMVNTRPNVRKENAEYLRTKKSKLGHHLKLEVDAASNGTIRFYHSDQPWGELSNFSPHAVFLDGNVWPTVEHFYQAQKFTEAEYREYIRSSATPTRAKQRAYERSAVRLREDWESVKEQVMLEGLRAKFEQHPDLRDRLVQSGDRLLVEHSDQDAYWGDGGDGTGLNRLGCLLMQVRSEIRKLGS